MDRLKLKAVLGSHPHVKAVKSGELRSDLFNLDFIEYTPTNAAFKPMVREQAIDVCEMAIVTYLMAKAHGKPLVLLPATMMGRFQHTHALYNPAHGTLGPSDLEGKRVGIRSFTTTTGAWIRGILANDYGVNLDKIRWVTFEDPHVAEYVDTTERAPEGKKIIPMLLAGELDAVLGDRSDDPRVRSLFGDPEAAAKAWVEKHRIVPLNHFVVVSGELAKLRPDLVEEVYAMLKESRRRAVQAGASAPPFGVAACRPALEKIVDYAAQQQLIPRRFEVDELFDDTTRKMI